MDLAWTPRSPGGGLSEGPSLSQMVADTYSDDLNLVKRALKAIAYWSSKQGFILHYFLNHGEGRVALRSLPMLDLFLEHLTNLMESTGDPFVHTMIACLVGNAASDEGHLNVHCIHIADLLNVISNTASVPLLLSRISFLCKSSNHTSARFAALSIATLSASPSLAFTPHSPHSLRNHANFHRGRANVPHVVVQPDAAPPLDGGRNSRQRSVCRRRVHFLSWFAPVRALHSQRQKAAKRSAPMTPFRRA